MQALMTTGNRTANQGDALSGCSQGLRHAFPGLIFDITNAGQTGSETASTEWVMSATNAGSVNGLPPDRAADLVSRGESTVRTRDCGAQIDGPAPYW